MIEEHLEPVPKLRGKTAIITGATAGIGRSSAIRFAEEGANLALVARRREPGEELAETLGPDKVLPISMDVTDPEAPERVVSLTKERFGQVDVLVNNAGMDFTKDFLEVSAEEMRKVFELNFFASARMLQAAAREMRSAGGSIINVTSELASISARTLSIYGSSKAALCMLGRTVALELAKSGVRVNSVAPAFTDTPLAQAWMDEQSDPESAMAEEISRIPIGRLIKPEEVANSILFLASDESTGITGATLAVDGGSTLI